MLSICPFTEICRVEQKWPWMTEDRMKPFLHPKKQYEMNPSNSSAQRMTAVKAETWRLIQPRVCADPMQKRG